MLSVLRLLRSSVDSIAAYDADLARQLRRASSSVLLNLAEGSGSFGGVRRARYRTALGSARETLACLRVGEALGYTGAVPAEVTDRMDRVIGTLVRVSA